jgi:hypothetical protein
MKKFILISFMLICVFQNKSTAQSSATTTAGVHEYYFMVHGIVSKDDVVSLEKLVEKQKGVTSISTKGFPVIYFNLSTTRPLSIEEIQGWLKTSTYEFQFITEDPKAKNKLDRIKSK